MLSTLLTRGSCLQEVVTLVMPLGKCWCFGLVAAHVGFILGHGLVRFPQFGKKMLLKIYVAASNGVQKK